MTAPRPRRRRAPSSNGHAEPSANGAPGSDAAELQLLRQRIAELEQQQAATSEILRATSASTAGAREALQIIVERAAQLCDTTDAALWRVDGNALASVLRFGPNQTRMPNQRGNLATMRARPVPPDTPWRVPPNTVIYDRTIHIPDALAGAHADAYRDSSFYKSTAIRSRLGTPLRREGQVVGALVVDRAEPRPFTDHQIALLETFASQAVIAIENARLFSELQSSNNTLTESLAQQTASAEVLRVIASSPSDLDRVLDTIVERAATLCHATEAFMRVVEDATLRVGATYGAGMSAWIRERDRSIVSRPISLSGEPAELNQTTLALKRRRTVRFETLDSEPELGQTARDTCRRFGLQTMVTVPLLHRDEAIGAITLARTEPTPFNDAEIALVESFADQAVIAIQNTRLFQELQTTNHTLTEALDQQTATSDVLRVIASSPADRQLAIETITESAARLTGADWSVMTIVEGEEAVVASVFPSAGERPHPQAARVGLRQPLLPDPDGSNWRVRSIVERRTLHFPNLFRDFPESGTARAGQGSLAIVPLMREGGALGCLAVTCAEPRPFTDQQIKLLESFADQAVIAIENARLFQELQTTNRTLTEALEQQTATAEVLNVIAQAPTDLQRVLDTIADAAAQLCESPETRIYRREGDELIGWSVNSALRAKGMWTGKRPSHRRLIDPGWAAGRAVLTGRTIHIEDALAVSDEEFAVTKALAKSNNFRSLLVTPLVRDGVSIGTISVARPEVRPFSPRQVALLETFANQALIAIENTRLFSELQERLAEQTATTDVLRVIASSPADLQTVLDTIAESAARLCTAYDAVVARADGTTLSVVAHFGTLETGETLAGNQFPLTRGLIAGRAIIDRQVLHIQDTAALPHAEYPDSRALQPATGQRTVLAAPLLSQDSAIGVLLVRRDEVKPFTVSEISLLQTFADQAVIAIENARLFQELNDTNRTLQDALDQQTATTDILRVIASSPTDLQKVLDTITENAARLCEANDGVVMRLDGDALVQAAHFGTLPITPPDERIPVTRGTINGRAVVDRRTIHVKDMEQLAEDDYPLGMSLYRRMRTRSVLVTPLLREGVPIGTINVRRLEPRPFSAEHIKLLESFADQAVIAIENSRLFQEIQERLAEQTATSDVLRVIASSPTDLQRVLQTITESAARVCGASDAALNVREGDSVRLVAGYGDALASESLPNPAGRPFDRTYSSHLSILEARVIHLPDVAAEADEEWAGAKRFAARRGLRTTLTVPLLRQGLALGSLSAYQREVRSFTDRQIRLFQSFADQAVIAIQNTRLFNELQESNGTLKEALKQQTVTAEVLRVISQTPTDLARVLSTISDAARRLCDADIADVLRLSDGTFSPWLPSAASPDLQARAISARHPGAPAATSVSGVAVRDRRTVHVADLSQEEERFPYSYQNMFLRQGIRTCAAAPLFGHGGADETHAIGVIWVQRAQQRPFSEQQIALLETFADQAAIAVENARLFQELQDRTQDLARSVDELRALGELNRVVSSSLDLETVLTNIVTRASALAGADGGSIYETDAATQTLHLHATHQFPEALVDTLRANPLHIGEGVAGQAVATRAPYQVPDISDDANYRHRLRDAVLQANFRALLGVPLLREDDVLGVMVLHRRSPGAFPDSAVELLQTFATQSALAIHNARLFKEIEEKSVQLEEASRHKSQFLANMSHELRTPLNAILGYTELIADGIYGQVPDKIQDIMERVQSSGRHLLGLINAVLDLSKIEAGQLVLAPVDYSLKELVHTVYTATESLAKEKGLDFQLEIAPDLPTGHADDRRLHQVLLNLVGNAIKFTDTGRVTICASTHPTDNTFLLQVQDTGPGIPPEEQDRIFEEFQQADSSSTRAKGGTGLGLAIARRIVELHGGRIWVESQPGQGSTFSVTIPVRTEALVNA